MAATPTRKLSNAFEGALAGGGDPATSPLYVFGPFLQLIVTAGVAKVTFGASVWLVVLTIAMVSAMYRLVMRWVTDGSGGSGLTEEEFGGWAVKINAGITFVEYTLTFLVSMAALVTFIADRLPVLNHPFWFTDYRALVAVVLSVFTGWAVNRGPKTAAAIFGPATAAVLLLLWAMNIATILKLGLHLPDFSLKAFTDGYLHYTLAGYARILAVMTGIEVFANLVAAYEGTPEEKSRKAFHSLLIIMGTAAVTMVVTGPAIFRLADPTNPDVSVFTQTMDKLLPPWLAYAGTLIGIAVLLSASAASAQGLQNLALGLKDRHYVPKILGRRNRYGVAPWPVWLEVAIASLCFLFIGTREEIYLSVYAAGVFILLSMTGWAAAKRLIRELRAAFDLSHAFTLAGTVVAAFLTTAATVIIFAERFSEGAWTYFVFIPLLYGVFSYYRRRLGAPPPLREHLGKVEEAMWPLPGGSGKPAIAEAEALAVEVDWQPTPERVAAWRQPPKPLRRILVPLGGTGYAEQAIDVALSLAKKFGGEVWLVHVIRTSDPHPADETLRQALAQARREKEAYLQQLKQRLKNQPVPIFTVVEVGAIAPVLNRLVEAQGIDLVVMTTHSKSAFKRWLMGSKASKILQLVNAPVLVFRPYQGEGALVPRFARLLVPLDGSAEAERVFPYVRALAQAFGGQLVLLGVLEVPDPALYGPLADVVARLRAKSEAPLRAYLKHVARVLQEEGVALDVVLTGGEPPQTILDVSESRDVDLVALTSHGKSGTEEGVLLGSTAERVVHHSRKPVLLVPIVERRVSAR